MSFLALPLRPESVSLPRGQHMAYGQFGADGALTGNFGYVMNRVYGQLALDFSLNIPTGNFLAPWNSNYEVMTRLPLWQSGAWQLHNSAGLKTYALNSFSYSGVSFHLEERAQFGYFHPAFYAAFHLGLRPRVARYLSPSEEIQKWNPGAEGGWYNKEFAGLYLAGLSLGGHPTDQLELGLLVLFSVPMESSVNALPRSIIDGVIALQASWSWGNMTTPKGKPEQATEDGKSPGETDQKDSPDSTTVGQDPSNQSPPVTDGGEEQ